MRLRIGRRTKERRKKSVGQSLVEFTIMLPILLMMLSGLIEFGFLLNAYLDVIDAARDAARFSANDDPTKEDPFPIDPPYDNFWHRAWQGARGSLATSSDGRINWNSTDPSDCAGVNGDIVVSAFEVLGTTVENRWPLGYPAGAFAGRGFPLGEGLLGALVARGVPAVLRGEEVRERGSPSEHHLVGDGALLIPVAVGGEPRAALLVAGGETIGEGQPIAQKSITPPPIPGASWVPWSRPAPAIPPSFSKMAVF